MIIMDHGMVSQHLEPEEANETHMLGMVSRDDLIRLVVGMQWREAIALMAYDAVADGIGAWLHRDAMVYDLRPAVDIVDEWLGVR